MRASTQWMILLLLTAAALTACPKDNGSTDSTTPPEVTATSSSANMADPHAIEQVYSKNCAMCHGKDMEGRPGMAPELMHSRALWKTPEEMVKYLQDPQAYTDKDPRLSAQRDKFSLKMPAIPTMTDEERLAIAKWLINR